MNGKASLAVGFYVQIKWIGAWWSASSVSVKILTQGFADHRSARELQWNRSVMSIFDVFDVDIIELVLKSVKK